MRYLDHAATTPLEPQVLEAMLPYLVERFGNPSEPHAAGRAARAGLDDARARVGEALGCGAVDVVFTGGGSEADNIAVLGRCDGPPGRLVVAAIEHPAVRGQAQRLAARGWDVAWLPCRPDGQVEAAALEELVRPGDALCALMAANNLTGVVQPVAAAAEVCARAGVPLHVDAVQAASGAALDVAALPGRVTLAVAAHKLGGPKGVGALVGPGLRDLAPVLVGGGQERGLRPGTESVALAAGLAASLALRQGAPAEWAARAARRDALEAGLPADVEIIGRTAPRLPGHSLLLTGVRGDTLVHVLDGQGICVAAGAACASGAAEPSHVLAAMGVPADAARTALRVSLGPASDDADVVALHAALGPAREALLAARGAVA